jgi:acetyltransferase-like isoleucine patch superfamily enzyme
MQPLFYKLLDLVFLNWLRNRLNKIGLSEYRVWGDPSRLRIADTAIINNALFNVVSGEVRIEDFVFFGHNVTVLTGTHDTSKFDRDRQFSAPSSGRDITIGRGAWIASNAIIMGPCKIGKHSVVAAGSLVNCDVPESCVFAGVPARLVKKLSPPT